MRQSNFLIGVLLLTLFTGCRRDSSVLGDQYLAAGMYEKAIENYNDHLKLKPKHVKSIYNRGRAYDELGEHDKAMVDYKRVLELEQDNPNALISVGQHYYRIEDYDQAMYYFESAVENDPGNAMGHFMKGRVYHKQGITRKAVDAYTNAINIQSNFGDAYLYRGAVRLHMRQQRLACGDFQKAEMLGVRGAAEALGKNCK